MTTQLVTLMCDNALFTIDIKLLIAHPDTMLGRMFGSILTHPNEQGIYEVANGISQSVFLAVMNFYTNGKMWCPSTMSIEELHQGCDYLLVPFDATTIQCQNLSEYPLYYLFRFVCITNHKLRFNIFN